MSPAQRMTAWFVVGTGLVFACTWIVYDLWVYHRHGNDATISRVMLLMGRAWPGWIVLWVAPVFAVMAHFWWPQVETRRSDDDEPPEARPPP